MVMHSGKLITFVYVILFDIEKQFINQFRPQIANACRGGRNYGKYGHNQLQTEHVSPLNGLNLLLN